MKQGFFLNADLERTTKVDYVFLRAIKSLLTFVRASPGFTDYVVSIEDVLSGVKLLVQSPKETIYARVFPYDFFEEPHSGYFDISHCVYMLIGCFNDIGYRPQCIEVFIKSFTIDEVKLDGRKVTAHKILL